MGAAAQGPGVRTDGGFFLRVELLHQKRLSAVPMGFSQPKSVSERGMETSTVTHQCKGTLPVRLPPNFPLAGDLGFRGIGAPVYWALR